ncbi:MAG TPA: glycosyltransferase 87 family protein [Mycobacteriales bacterium]|nr:glycosyltransferase 87 family protein [Mycobacteriales bacterium]
MPSRRALPVLLACVAVLTLSGYLLKGQCIGHYNELRDKNLCSNDIQVLYQLRDMQHHPFPYVHGDLVDHQLVGGALEYPVLTGLFAWLPALLVDDDGQYLTLTALWLAPFSFLTVWMLGRMVRWRALLYALAPPLVWYSFHNWDLLVVCATVAAFFMWWKRRYAWSGAWLAVGASLKFWPLLLALPLVLDRLAAGERREAVRAGGTFAGVLLAVQLPFLLASPQGWWAPYAFQKERAADITANSIWFWGFPHLSTADLNHLVPALLVAGTLVACAVGWLRARAEGVFPFVQVCGALLVLFVVTGKAHSPQYALWLLPFFCLVRLRWGWWVGYMVFDALMYVGVFRWYYDLAHGHDFGLAKQALVLGVWGRAAMLVLLFVVLLRAQPAFEEVDQ